MAAIECGLLGKKDSFEHEERRAESGAVENHGLAGRYRLGMCPEGEIITPADPDNRCIV